MVNERDRPAGLCELTPLTEGDHSIPPPHLGTKFTRESRELGSALCLIIGIISCHFLTDRPPRSRPFSVSAGAASLLRLHRWAHQLTTKHGTYFTATGSKVPGKIDVHFQESPLPRSLDKRTLFSLHSTACANG